MLLPLLITLAAGSQDMITAAELRDRLNPPPEGAEAERLAVRVRASLPEGADPAGGAVFFEGDQAAFVLEAPAIADPAPRLEGIVTRQRGRPLVPIGRTGLWAAVLTVPADARFGYEFRIGRRQVGGGTVEMPGWDLPPESSERPGAEYGEYVPLEFRSAVFGNDRTGWVYVPAAYDGSGPAALLVVQDGDAYRRIHIGTVVENLIADGAMPVTIVAGFDPGVNDDGSSNRSVEYDTLSDRYATFLADEVIPRLEAKYNLRDDPGWRAICGASSGGICAFTVAWERPDLFARVCSHIGSFTDIRGGHVYPDLVRDTPRKPIVKIVLHDGRNDLINRFGDWWEANNRMFESLEAKGYDVEFLTDASFHSFESARRVLPETLRLTWEGWGEPR